MSLLYSLSSNFLHARTTGADRGEYGQNSGRHDGCRESTERNGKMLWHLCAAMEKVRKQWENSHDSFIIIIGSVYKTAVIVCALYTACPVQFIALRFYQMHLEIIAFNDIFFMTDIVGHIKHVLGIEQSTSMHLTKLLFLIQWGIVKKQVNQFIYWVRNSIIKFVLMT